MASVSPGGSCGFGGMLYQYNIEAMVSNHKFYDYLCSWEMVYDNENHQIYMVDGQVEAPLNRIKVKGEQR